MEILQQTNPHFYIAIAISILNGVLLCFVAGKLFQMLQLSGYKLSGYNAWLKDTKIKFVGRLFMLAFLSLISILVTNALLNGFGGYYCYLGLIFYLYFSVVFIINMTKMPQKTPLKQTRRMNRLIATVFVLITLISFGLIILATEYVPFLKYGVIVLTPLLLTFIVPVAHVILIPIEKLIRLKYIRGAKAKLVKMPNLIKIGITGSYGKTTTKHILNVLLSTKYSVCMTPHSFNTPMGLTKVVLKYLKKHHQVLIAEMGARNVGDIKELCNLISPKHGIITAVGSQHLATFGTEENIAKTKNELVQSITNGYVVFNGNSNGAQQLYNNCQKQKYLAALENEDAFCNIKNIKVNSKGSTFTLCIENEEVECSCKLIGRHLLEDIAISCAMAYNLGVRLKELQTAIATLKPMSHRMEVINSNGLTIIDNAYNSSVESSTAALETLKLFDNNNKIVVTPGLVEMGEKEQQVNIEFGEKIAKVANKVIIVNKINLESIKQGLLNEGYNEENIFEAANLKDATAMLGNIAKSGDIILFENDLPDNYT